MLLNKGCVTTLRNKENQLAYDLAVRNPEVGRLLMTHTGMYMYNICSVSPMINIKGGGVHPWYMMFG